MDLFDKVPDSRALKHFETYLRQTRKQTVKRNRWLLIGCLFGLSLGTCYILASDELIYNVYFVLLAFVRTLLIKVLPVWDWTRMYTSRCMVNNPFFNNSLDLSECTKCANTTEVVRQSNLTFFNFTKNVYLNHLPIIVEDATQSWPAMKGLTVETLFRLYAEDPVLSEHDLCYFESNIEQLNKPGGADQLFNDYLSGNRRPFKVHWNNCQRETLKIIRSYYSKPYFLPPSVGQTLMGNWFLISVGLQKGPVRFQAVPVNDQWTWLAQIQGRSAVELRPQRICKGTCAVLKSIELNKGDLMMYSRLYQAVYRPLTKEAVLLAQGVD